jgi:hypothetical protein
VAIDIYVGPWVRYYRGDWLTGTQQAAAQLGVPAYVARPGPDGRPVISPAGPPEKVNTPEEIRQLTTAWQAGLAELLGERLRGSVDWGEDAGGDYFTDRPDWIGLSAVRHLAAHEQFPGLRLPDVWNRAAATASATEIAEAYEGHAPLPAQRRGLFRRTSPPACSPGRFDHLLLANNWVPVDFDPVVIYTDLPAEGRCQIGSTYRLLEELKLLNERTLRLDTKGLASARRKGPPPSRSFKWSAKFGLSVLLPLVEMAVERRLPILVDY